MHAGLSDHTRFGGLNTHAELDEPLACMDNPKEYDEPVFAPMGLTTADSPRWTELLFRNSKTGLVTRPGIGSMIPYTSKP